MLNVSLDRSTQLLKLLVVLTDWDESQTRGASPRGSIGHTYTLFIAFVQEALVAMPIAREKEREREN